MLLFPVRPCDIFTSKYIAVILFCYAIEILLLLPVCIIQTQYMGDISAIITYISAAAILPHIVAFPLAVLVTICLKIAMLLKRMRTMLVVTGIIVYFAGGVVGVLLSNGQIGAERDLLNWVNNLIVPFPFYNSYIRFHPGLKLFCIILAAVFIGGYYYLSNLVIGKKYAIYDKEGRIRLKAMKYNSSSKLRSYFKKEYQTFFRNPVYVINGLFGIFITPFYCRCLSDQCNRREYRTNKSLGISPGIFLLCGTVCACGNCTYIRNQCSGLKQFFQRGGKFLDNEDHSVFIKAASVCESPVFCKYLYYGDYHKLLNIQGLF